MSTRAAGGFDVDEAPPPPPGPGVAPPFAAPPVDRGRRGLWIGLGIGAVALVLCCVGGLFGLGVVVVAGSQQAEQQAATVVGAYLDAMQAVDGRAAHTQLCTSLASKITVEDLESEARNNAIVSYTIDPPSLGSNLTVDATVLYRGGRSARIHFVLVAERQSWKICDIR